MLFEAMVDADGDRAWPAGAAAIKKHGSASAKKPEEARLRLRNTAGGAIIADPAQN